MLQKKKNHNYYNKTKYLRFLIITEKNQSKKLFFNFINAILPLYKNTLHKIEYLPLFIFHSYLRLCFGHMNLFNSVKYKIMVGERFQE